LGLAAREDEQYQSLRALYLVPFQRSRLAAGTSSLAVVLVIGLLATLSIQSVSLIGVALAVDRGKQVEATDRSSAVAPLAFSAAPSVHLEDLTWPEVQGLLAGGTHVVIVPTGGIEQNGLHMILGKHNYIVREAGEAIAKKLGNALVAPVISYVPQGDIDPPSGHMKFPGTLSVSDRVFEAVLEQTARSLKRHGFRMICFVGDSGGNQEGQQRVAERLTKLWRDDGVRVVHVGDYYFANGQLEWLEARGESVKAIGTHAGIRDTSELLFVRPQGVRTDSIRQSVERSSQTGTIGDPSRATKEYGEALLAKKVDAAVQQILPFVSDLRKAAQVESGRLRLPTNQNW
jgi:creatinine amidohydrolase/Fe(II)-dependent formamide hydrolase-like protein